MKNFFSNLANLLKLAYQGWTADNASRLSAALAYYTIFSLAPLLVIVIAITGLIWDAGVVQTQILSQVQSLVGAEVDITDGEVRAAYNGAKVPTDRMQLLAQFFSLDPHPGQRGVALS